MSASVVSAIEPHLEPLMDAMALGDRLRVIGIIRQIREALGALNVNWESIKEMLASVTPEQIEAWAASIRSLLALFGVAPLAQSAQFAEPLSVDFLVSAATLGEVNTQAIDIATIIALVKLIVTLVGKIRGVNVA